MEEKIVLAVKCELNNGISRGYDLTLTDIDFEEDDVMSPNSVFGNGYMTQKYVFESFTDIIYDPNMMHAFKIDKKVNEKLGIRKEVKLPLILKIYLRLIIQKII